MSAELTPADSASNGSIVSSSFSPSFLQPPVMPVFTLPADIVTMTSLDVARAMITGARGAHDVACGAYAVAYAAYLESCKSLCQPAPPVVVQSSSVVSSYGAQFSHCSSARSKGWREGTSFGSFQYSTRGSTNSVVSSSVTEYPDGKCYLAFVAGGHKRSTQLLLGRWPRLVDLLRVPAVKLDVIAMFQHSFQLIDGMVCHVVPYSGCSVMAALAGFISRNSGTLGIHSSSWEGSLLHAIMSRADFVELLDASRFVRLGLNSIVGSRSSVDVQESVTVAPAVAVPDVVELVPCSRVPAVRRDAYLCHPGLLRDVVRSVGAIGEIGEDRYREFTFSHPSRRLRTAVYDLVFDEPGADRELRGRLMSYGDGALRAVGRGVHGEFSSHQFFLTFRSGLVTVEGMMPLEDARPSHVNHQAVYDAVCVLFAVFWLFGDDVCITRFCSDVLLDSADAPRYELKLVLTPESVSGYKSLDDSVLVDSVRGVIGEHYCDMSRCVEYFDGTYVTLTLTLVSEFTPMMCSRLSSSQQVFDVLDELGMCLHNVDACRVSR